VATLFAFACGGSTPSDTSKGEISIGVDLPISGAEGSQGLPTLNGVKYAVQLKGSIGGYKLTVDAKDDSVNGTHDAQKGAQNVRDLISNSKVLGMIGPFNSSVARAEIPITNAANLTMISPANTNQCLTKNVYIPTSLGAPKDVTCKDAGLPSPTELRPNGKNNYFRVPTTDDLQGPALADYLYDTLKLTSVGVQSLRPPGLRRKEHQRLQAFPAEVQVSGCAGRLLRRSDRQQGLCDPQPDGRHLRREDPISGR
jgi:branched-chain amino acid transport system substrate-binding protein